MNYYIILIAARYILFPYISLSLTHSLHIFLIHRPIGLKKGTANRCLSTGHANVCAKKPAGETWPWGQGRGLDLTGVKDRNEMTRFDYQPLTLSDNQYFAYFNIQDIHSLDRFNRGYRIESNRLLFSFFSFFPRLSYNLVSPRGADASSIHGIHSGIKKNSGTTRRVLKTTRRVQASTRQISKIWRHRARESGKADLEARTGHRHLPSIFRKFSANFDHRHRFRPPQFTASRVADFQVDPVLYRPFFEA